MTGTQDEQRIGNLGVVFAGNIGEQFAERERREEIMLGNLLFFDYNERVRPLLEAGRYQEADAILTQDPRLRPYMSRLELKGMADYYMSKIGQTQREIARLDELEGDGHQ